MTKAEEERFIAETFEEIDGLLDYIDAQPQDTKNTIFGYFDRLINDLLNCLPPGYEGFDRPFTLGIPKDAGPLSIFAELSGKVIDRLVQIPWPERDVFEIYATDRIYQLQTAHDREGKITSERAKWMKDEWGRRGSPPLRQFAKKVLRMSKGDTGYKPLRWPFFDKVLFNMSYWGHEGEYELLLNTGETLRWRRVAMLKLLYNEPRKFTKFVDEHLQEFFDTDPPEVLVKPMVSKIGWVSEYLNDKMATYRIIHQYSKRAGIPITPPDDDYTILRDQGLFD